MDISKLKQPFPESQISWRAQSVTKDGNKALALAYIDARDVMNRLDDVIGPANWKDRYIDSGKRTYCTISIRASVFDELNTGWVSKSDAAGDSEVEAEKGAVSDAFKRAAVKWGIGRYLYDMPAPWVPCESYDIGGKKKFSKFTEDPWKYVKNAPDPAAPKRALYIAVEKELNATKDADEVDNVWISRTEDLVIIKNYSKEGYDKLEARKNDLLKLFGGMK